MHLRSLRTSISEPIVGDNVYFNRALKWKANGVRSGRCCGPTWKSPVESTRQVKINLALSSRRPIWLALVLIFASSGVRAQEQSRWGIIASITPRWQAPSQIEKVKIFNGAVYLDGSDFTIGVIRGRSQGGDWGISFVRQRWKDDSLVQDVEEQCGFINVASGCLRSGTSYLTRGVTVNGVMVHSYLPFVTIKRRVQLGVNLAGGIGQLQGDVEKHELSVVTDFVSRSSRAATGRQRDIVTTSPAKELAKWPVLPLGAIQPALAVIIAPGLKLRVAGGFDFPGYSKFAVTGVYLIGSE